MFIFGWKIYAIFDLIFIVSFILLCISVFIYRQSLPIDLLAVLGLLGMICIYTLLVHIIYSANGAQMVLRSIRVFINFAGAISLVNLMRHFYRGDYLKYLVFFMYFSIVLHSAIVILMFYSDGIREFVYYLVNTRSIVNITSSFIHGFRVPGLTYALSQLSVLTMFAFLLSPIVKLLWQTTDNVKTVVLASSNFLVFISLFMTGRTGIILSIILLPIYWLMLYRSKLAVIKVKLVLFFCMGMICSLIALSALSEFNIKEFVKDFDNVYYAIEHSEEVIELFSNYGSTYSTRIIASMYFFPESDIHLLFGSAKSVSSDVGFVKSIYAIGLIGTLLMLVVPFYGVFKVFFLPREIKWLKSIILIVTAAILILNFKELSVMTRNIWSVHALLLVAVFLVAEDYKRGRFFCARARKKIGWGQIAF